MKIIKTPEEFESFYYYDKKYLKTKDYPKKYPCICEQIEQGGGVAGEWVEHRITYIPKWADLKSWLEGFKMGRKDD